MNQEREALKIKYGKLFDSISDDLFKADPIGIKSENNADEYDPEAGTIIPRLNTARSSEDVHSIVYEEFCAWFGIDIAGAKANYLEVSKTIWELWCELKRAGQG